MRLAYRKQIIQNQRKTARRAVTINLCWRKSSCELFPLATTHEKVANGGSGKMVIARKGVRKGVFGVKTTPWPWYFANTLL